MKTWGDRETTRAQYSQKGPTSPSVDGRDPVDVALNVSKRLISVFKRKKALNIESGLEMMALGVIICSIVSNFGMYLNHFVSSRLHKNGGGFPESAGGAKDLFRRFGFLYHVFSNR